VNFAEITSLASKGIGLAIADAFAREGAQVITGSRSINAQLGKDRRDMGLDSLLREDEYGQFHHVAVIVDATLKSGSIAESGRGAHVSGGLSHRRPTTIVDQVPPESICAAARDIACRAFDVHVLAVGTCAIN
jgi:NAD(P)-dependent dehydrogenase (short-subunit alcohol dehydrogenase family)